MDYYSGQGHVTAAKRNADGSLGPKFRLGNVPRVVVDFANRKFSVDIEQLSYETLEIICGSIPQRVGDKLQLEIGDGCPFEFELFLNLKNMATDGEPLEGHLYRVVFKSAEHWELLGDGIASARVPGQMLKDETRSGKIGLITYSHKESQTGNRLTDMKLVADA